MKIVVENLNCQINGNTILDGLSLSIPSGDFISIVGSNGAGKTTLLRCLAGLLPCSGLISFNGECARSISHRARSRIIGYLPQVVGEIPAFTVRQFILMGRYPHSGFFSPLGAADHQIAHAAIEQCDLTDLSEQPIASLSGGERQRVLFAALIAQQPQIFLLDEPTSFLDPSHENALFTLINRLHIETGKTVVIVSHNLNRTILSSKRIIALKQGRIAFDNTPAAFVNGDTLREIYGTDFYTVDHPHYSVPMVLPG